GIVPSTASLTSALCTLSLHDALPIWIGGDRGSLARFLSPPFHLGEAGHSEEITPRSLVGRQQDLAVTSDEFGIDSPFQKGRMLGDRKSTRLNSSHVKISYAVFCLKKK